MRKFICAILFVLLAFAPTTTTASPLYAGEGKGVDDDWFSVSLYEDGNWGGHHNVTAVEFFRFSGDQLFVPGANFPNGPGTWTSHMFDVNHAKISGPPSATSPWFNLTFDDNSATGTAKYYYVAHGEGATPTDLEGSTFGSDFLGYGFITYYNNNTYNWQQLQLSQNGFHPVPEPASLMLLGFGLVGVARQIRRRA